MANDPIWGLPPTLLDYRRWALADRRPGSKAGVYGTPLPIVYGTSRVVGKPVFMANATTAIGRKWEAAPGGADGSVPTWSSAGSYAIGNWVMRGGGYYVCITPSTGYTDARDPLTYPHYWLPASQVAAEAGRWAIAPLKDEHFFYCQAGSTASSFNASGADLGGSANAIKKLPYSVARVLTFYSGPNAGLSRLLTATCEYPTFAVSTPFPNAPAATGNPSGDLFGISRPVLLPSVAAILGVCEAPVTSITKVFVGGAPAATDLTYATGVFATTSTVLDAASSTWSVTEAYKAPDGSLPAQGMKFAGTVQVRTTALLLEDNKVPEIGFEVKGIGAASSTDAHPADVLLDLLNRLPTPLASLAQVDVGPDGLAASSYRTYCTAMGFAVSRTIDSSTPATTLVEELLYQTGATLIWSEGLIKVIPLGDKAVGSYVPPSTSLAITTDDILAEKGEDPIQAERTPEEDVVNTITVEFPSRVIDYEARTVEYSDTAHVTQFGVRRGTTVRAEWVATDAHAMALASIIVGRSVRIRNTFRFRLPVRFALLEPMDFVSLTDAKAGLSNVQARIKEIEEQKDGTLQVTAYEWPVGATNVVAYPVQTYDGYIQAQSQPSAERVARTAADVAETAATPDLANVEPGSVTAPLVSIPLLSDITANVGTLTAGVIQNTAGTAKFDLTNSKVIFDNGTVVKITGLGFGTSNQLIEWVGLRASILSGGVISPALCSTSNSIQHITSTGDAYFKGTLNVGTISNSGQTSNTSANASIDVGPFGSNGGNITVAYSLTCGGEGGGMKGSGPAGTNNFSTSHTIVVERSVNGGAFSQVATQTVGGTQTEVVDPYDGEQGGYPFYVTTSVSGSYTLSDTLHTTQDRIYRLRITSRTLGYGTHPGFTQRLSLTSQE